MNDSGVSPLTWVVSIFLGALLTIGLLVGGASGCKAWGRYQARADASNRVKINHTRIKYYNQQKGIERIQAEIRVIHSIGIRKAQDHIAATLTPLYVAFEETQALKEIAKSGKNNSVVFVPTNPATGLPIVPGITEKTGKSVGSGK